MKKILIISALMAVSLLTTAQTRRGDKLIGVSFGSLSFTSSDNQTTYSNTPVIYNSDGSSFSISINPNVAWFIKDNLAIGGGVSVGFFGSDSKSSNTASSSVTESDYTQPSFYIGPLARYYFGGSAKGMPFVQANAQIGISGGNSKSKTTSGASSETSYKPKGDWNAGLTFGYEHFITPSVGLFGSIGFSYGISKTTYEYRPSTGSGYDYTVENSRFYIPVNVGLQVHLLRSKK